MLHPAGRDADCSLWPQLSQPQSSTTTSGQMVKRGHNCNGEYGFMQSQQSSANLKDDKMSFSLLVTLF